MDEITVNLLPAQKALSIIWPLLMTGLFIGFSIAFVKVCRKVQNDGDCVAVAGCAIISIATGAMMLVMTWHSFANSLNMQGY